jgi:adenylate cyclase
MPIEIERKFLVLAREATLPSNNHHIKQGYLSTTGTAVRVRIMGEQGFIGLKSPRLPAGTTVRGMAASIARAEYEYEIPKRDAEELMLLCEIRVSKTRYYLPGGFELDVFEEQLNGLELLEYESDDVESMPGIPEGFRVLEVTGDPVFNNIRLAKDGIPESLKARSLQE